MVYDDLLAVRSASVLQRGESNPIKNVIAMRFDNYLGPGTRNESEVATHRSLR